MRKREEVKLKRYRINYVVKAHTEIQEWGIEDAEEWVKREENDPDVSVDGVSIDGDGCSYRIREIKE